MTDNAAIACEAQLLEMFPRIPDLDEDSPPYQAIMRDGIQIGIIHIEAGIKNQIYLDLIRLDEEMRGGGIGQEILETFLRITDQHACTTYIMVFCDPEDPEGGRLARWYRRNGYEPSFDLPRTEALAEFGRPAQPVPEEVPEP